MSSPNKEEENAIDPENIDLIIRDLKTSFDNLEKADFQETQGFQVKLAKTIASLREMKVSMAGDQSANPSGAQDKDSRNYLLNQLDFFLYMLDQIDDSKTENQRKKFDLIMKIAKLREKLREI
ncbi:MAG: hypothetical protein JW891_05175 [Candidatus Lokiarchaeota archaeon]|nr:hypothetical protein [Candidatus Lokiarchaeota archaeon]